MEQHEDVVAFSVEGDDLGRRRRLVKLRHELETSEGIEVSDDSRR